VYFTEYRRPTRAREMNDQEPRQWPGYTEDAYPEVFNTMTAQPKTLKPGQISEEKARQFFDEVLCHQINQIVHLYGAY